MKLMKEWLRPETSLPADHHDAVLVGRAWVPAVGPTLVRIREGELQDLSPLAATTSQLLDLEDAAAAVRAARGLRRIAGLEDVLSNSMPNGRDETAPWFLAPCDLQAIKASGVTFVSSLLERVIEEQARGDSAKAAGLRQSITSVIGDNLQAVRPGSEEAQRLKDVLIAQGVWSQYLEVGIGPDAEIFTKAPPMAAVGTGAEVGIHPKSAWNNPEPEVVLAINRAGQVIGAALGNDVNLRDFEGRSALLLGKAKDNNASCAIGPFIRLFDRDYGIEDLRRTHIKIEIAGPDGYKLSGESHLINISRDPLDLASQAVNRTHQYPDGTMLFLGTQFAPVQDRDQPGKGFTHKIGDVVSIRADTLGMLVNRVNHCDKVAPWTFGINDLMHNLSKRGLL